MTHEQYRPLLGNLRGALGSTEALLGGLLDISRLDAGRLQIQHQDFPLAQVLEPMVAEFQVVHGWHRYAMCHHGLGA